MLRCQARLLTHSLAIVPEPTYRLLPSDVLIRGICQSSASSISRAEMSPDAPRASDIIHSRRLPSDDAAALDEQDEELEFMMAIIDAAVQRHEE